MFAVSTCSGLPKETTSVKLQECIEKVVDQFAMLRHTQTERIITPSGSHRIYADSLCGTLPVFSCTDRNRIVWYQYRTSVTSENIPFYVTYPAEWCWDIDGQWLRFRDYYAINPRQASIIQSRFSIKFRSREMICDLLNMKLIDHLSGEEKELRRTHTLTGVIVGHGQIAFDRYYSSQEREIFLYDRATGCNEAHHLAIGDRVEFEVWWNKNENEGFYYDATHIQTEGVHHAMFAFNVQRVAKKTPKDAVVNRAVEYTTPLLNKVPIPPNTASGRDELAKYVDLKLNAMMMVAEYMLDSRWNVILNMAASKLYNAQRTAWMLMKGLENDAIRRRTAHSNTKTIAIAYCQTMGWKRPVEQTNGYKASVTVGKGDWVGNGNTIDEAYNDLIPRMIPKVFQKEKGKVAPKHPKTRVLEWAQHQMMTPPKTVFTEILMSKPGMRGWSARLSFGGKAVEAFARKKKEAESKCYHKLLAQMTFKL
eukprot:307837_1